MSAVDIIYKFLIPLIAVFIGAVAAFRYQRTTELKRDKRTIIQTLMIYRNVGAHEMSWINALNAIDIAFHSNKKVRELYHTFLAQTRPPFFENRQYVETFYQLIAEMAKCTEYKNLSLQDIRDFYSPEALNLHYPNMNIPNVPTVTAEVEKKETTQLSDAKDKD